MLNFYKPNAANSGHLLGLKFNSKEGSLYAQFVKQTKWDAAAHKGCFQGGAKFNIKVNATEIGAILNIIERGKTEKLFHQSPKGNTSIEIKPFTKKAAEGETPVKNGFTISVNPRANDGEEKPQTFGFWFNESEARLLKEYLQYALRHFFDALYSFDKAERAEYLKNQKGDAPTVKAPSRIGNDDF